MNLNLLHNADAFVVDVMLGNLDTTKMLVLTSQRISCKHRLMAVWAYASIWISI